MVVVAIIGITAGVINNTDIFIAQKAKSESSALQVYNVLRQARSIAIIERQDVAVNISGKTLTVTPTTTLTTAQGQRLRLKLNEQTGTDILKVSGDTSSSDASFPITFTPRGLIKESANAFIQFQETRDENLSNEYVEIAFTGLVKHCKGSGLTTCEDN